MTEKELAREKIKAFTEKIIAYLKESGKGDRVMYFKKGSKEMIKFIMAKFNEVTIFIGPSEEASDASLVF